MKRILVFAVALACVAASTATAEASAKFTNRMVTVKVSGSMKTNWSASPVADPSCENKPSGSSGGGTETVTWSNSKAIKGQLTGSGKSWGLMYFDTKNKPTFQIPMSGDVKRSGQGLQIACGETLPDRSQNCIGQRAFSTVGQLVFAPNGKFQADDDGLTMTTSLYPDCDWIWDSMVVRVGALLINMGEAKFDPKRLAGKSSVTLHSSETKKCENEGGDPGVKCATTTDWRVTLYPYKKRKR